MDTIEINGSLEEVNVAIHKSGKNQPVARVDHSRFRAPQFVDPGIVANDNNSPASNGYRLRPGVLGVDRVNLAVLDDDIRRRTLSGLAHGDRRCEQKRSDASNSAIDESVFHEHLKKD